MTPTIELERLVRTSDLHGLARRMRQAVLAAGARPAHDDLPEGVREERNLRIVSAGRPDLPASAEAKCSRPR